MATNKRHRSGILSVIFVLGFLLPLITGCNSSTAFQGTSTTGHAATSTPIPAPSLVQRSFQRTDDSYNTNSQSFSQGVLSGDVIVVAITQFQWIITGLSDSQSDSYELVSTQLANTAPDNDYAELFYAKNVKGGATVVSVMFSENTDANVGIYEFSHLNNQSPFDKRAAVSDSGNIPNGGLITTTQNREVLFVVGVDDNDTDAAGHIVPPTAGSGYTLLDHTDDNNNERFYDEYRVVSPGAYQTDFKIASNDADWGVIGVSFKQ